MMMIKIFVMIFGVISVHPVAAAEKSVKCEAGFVIASLGTDSARFVDLKSGNVTDVYGGEQKIVDIAGCGNGVITAFSGGGVYYSPTCFAIGRAGAMGTQDIYKNGAQKVRSMRSIGNEVEIHFEQGGNYITKGCKEAGVHRVD